MKKRRPVVRHSDLGLERIIATADATSSPNYVSPSEYMAALAWQLKHPIYMEMSAEAVARALKLKKFN